MAKIVNYSVLDAVSLGVLVVLESVSSQCEVTLFMIPDLEIVGFRDLLVCQDRKMRNFGSFLPVIASTPFCTGNFSIKDEG
jgi:hypothetical protein